MKYRVVANTESWSSIVSSFSKSFKTKKDALKYAKDVIIKHFGSSYIVTNHYNKNKELYKSEWYTYNGKELKFSFEEKITTQTDEDEKELKAFNRLKNKKGVKIEIDNGILYLKDYTKPNSFFKELNYDIIYTNTVAFLKKIKAI